MLHLLRAERTSLENAHYLVLCNSFQGMKGLLKRYGLRPLRLRKLTKEQQDAILHDYVEALGLMAEVNGQDMQWWATNIASKNRFLSPMPPLLNALVRCLDAIEKVAEDRRLLVFLGPPWPVVEAIEKSAGRLDWDLQVVSWPWSRFTARLLGQAKTWMGLVRELAVSIARILEVKLHFGGMPPQTGDRRPVYLIKSFVYPNAFSDNSLYKDPFFGKLRQFLSRRLGDGVDILTVTIGSQKRTECYRRMRDVKEGRVVPLEVYLHWLDAVKGFVEVTLGRMTRKFRVPEKVSFLGYDISILLRETLASGGWKIPLSHYLHFAAAVRIAKRHNVLGCALTYEGNPWERMFIKGLQAGGRPDVFIAGYQHAVIPQSSAGMFVSQRELGSIPLPSMVLTTGPAPAAIMLRYGALASGLVKAACALRYGYLYDIQPIPRHIPDGPFCLLVVLEGVRDVLPLVKYVLDHAPNCHNTKFHIRAHPVLPFERLLSYLGDAKIQENVEVSHGYSILEDLGRCDAVLYWGTTVALEALMLGKPVIHFDRGDSLSYDPLFELEDFKWTVAGNTDLNTILTAIRRLADHEYSMLQQRARDYVMDYFRPVNDDSMSKFLPKEVLYGDTTQ